MIITITSAGLTDGMILANASTIATALIGHPFALQFGADTTQVLAVIAERTPPTANAAEARFLRDAIRVVEQVEMAISREAPA
jgi:hypothetical protein